jgi:hypothetical protein
MRGDCICSLIIKEKELDNIIRHYITKSIIPFTFMLHRYGYRTTSTTHCSQYHYLKSTINPLLESKIEV